MGWKYNNILLCLEEIYYYRNVEKFKKFILKTYPYWVGIILVLGFVLRVYALGKPNLWRDEAFTVLLSEKDFTELLSIAVNDTTPPLLEIVLYIWIKILGDSEFSVRFPSLLASMGTIWFILLISKKYFSKLDSLVIILLSSCNFVSIHFAQEARAYALLSFLSVGSVYYLLNLLDQKENKKIYSILYILFTVCSFYTHNLAIFLIATQFLLVSVILFKRKQIKREFLSWFSRYLIIGIVCLPWLILTYIQAAQVQEDFWLNFHPWNSVMEAVGRMLIGYRLYTHAPYCFFDSISTIILVILLFMGIGSELAESKKKSPIFSFLYIGPITLIYIGSFITPLMYIRYISFLVPFLILLIYKGLKLMKRRFLLYPVLSVLIIASWMSVFCRYRSDNNLKPFHKNLSDDIQTFYKKSDVIIHMSSLSYFPFEYYSKGEYASYIYDPDYDVPFYNGKILIPERAYIHNLSTLEKYDRVLAIVFLSDFNDVDTKVGDFEKEYFQCTEKAYGSNLFLKIFAKDEITCNPHSEFLPNPIKIYSKSKSYIMCKHGS